MATGPIAGVAIRWARRDEADALSALAIRSKAHWGYDAAFMAACVPALTIEPWRIDAEHFFVAEADGRILGFGGVRIDDAECSELTNLFVDPPAIGTGLGRRLFEHGAGIARAAGCRRMRIGSDRFAEAFYLAMGAVRVGEVESDAIPGRMNPLLSYQL